MFGEAEVHVRKGNRQWLVEGRMGGGFLSFRV